LITDKIFRPLGRCLVAECRSRYYMYRYCRISVCDTRFCGNGPTLLMQVTSIFGSQL